MDNYRDPIPREPDRSERKYDLLTFALAGALAIFILAAVGYGIVTSSRVVSTVPLSSSTLPPIKTATPQTRRGTPATTPTTGAGDASAQPSSTKGR